MNSPTVVGEFLFVWSAVSSREASSPSEIDRGTVDGVYTIDRVTFCNEETGFAVVQILPADKLLATPVVAVGVWGQPQVGQCYRVRGKWKNDPRFGRQVRVASATPETPRSLPAIERYLAGASIKGLGATYAKRLVAHFGEETFDELQNGGPRLRQVPGIGRVRAAQIRTSWAEHQGLHDLMVNLQGEAGLSPRQAQKVFRTYGAKAWDKVKQDPYRLAQDISGFGFHRCDRIAREMGIAFDAPERLRAALLHVMGQDLNDGHLWSERTAVVLGAAELTQAPQDAVTQQVDVLLGQQALTAREMEGAVDALFLPDMDRVEQRVADRLGWLLREPSTSRLTFSKRKAERLIAAQSEGFLTDEQALALRYLLTGTRLTVLTGGPGTGKTTAIRTLIACLEAGHISYALCATTGRAAKQLAASTKRQAATVHRHLGIGTRQREAQMAREQVLVVDESSMIDIWLADEILRRVGEGTHLMLVGDIDQLPSVGPGAVLQDLIRLAETGENDQIRVVRLSRIFRQEAGDQSLVVVNCHRVRDGERPLQPEGRDSDYFEMHRETPEEAAALAVDLVCKRLPAYLEVPASEIQVLTPMHRGAAGVQSLNTALQQALNPPMQTRAQLAQGIRGQPEMQRVFREGDKVRQMQNNYEKLVFNGDLGRIRRIYRQERTLVVAFDERDVAYGYDEVDQLSHAWAMTVHAAQGSQWPAVVVLMLKSHFVMLERNILYTALSRAQRLAVLVTQEQALRMAVSRDRSIRRRTFLVDRMR